jgi:predicted HicB family RNase H-like nuclease
MAFFEGDAVAARKADKPRSARARGLRTLQHQTLPPKTRYAIDTEVWFRGLVVEHQPAARHQQRWSTKDQVHDEAIAWFLEQHADRPFEPYPARRAADEDLTFWVDSRLMQRARRMAQRDGVKVARLIDAALSCYVRQHLPEALLQFRQRVQLEAYRLYQGVSPRAGRARRARKAGA